MGRSYAWQGPRRQQPVNNYPVASCILLGGMKRCNTKQAHLKRHQLERCILLAQPEQAAGLLAVVGKVGGRHQHAERVRARLRSRGRGRHGGAAGLAGRMPPKRDHATMQAHSDKHVDTAPPALASRASCQEALGAGLAPRTHPDNSGNPPSCQEALVLGWRPGPTLTWKARDAAMHAAHSVSARLGDRRSSRSWPPAPQNSLRSLGRAQAKGGMLGRRSRMPAEATTLPMHSKTISREGLRLTARAWQQSFGGGAARLPPGRASGAAPAHPPRK